MSGWCHCFTDMQRESLHVVPMLRYLRPLFLATSLAGRGSHLAPKEERQYAAAGCSNTYSIKSGAQRKSYATKGRCVATSQPKQHAARGSRHVVLVSGSWNKRAATSGKHAHAVFSKTSLASGKDSKASTAHRCKCFVQGWTTSSEAVRLHTVMRGSDHAMRYCIVGRFRKKGLVISP